MTTLEKPDLSLINPETGLLKTPAAGGGTPVETPVKPDTEKAEGGEPGKKAEEKETPAVEKGGGKEPETPATVADTAAQKAKEEPAKSLGEILKGFKKEEVFSHLGLDETDISFHEFRKSGGDPVKYLEASTRDWNKMSETDVLRHSLRSQYPDVNGEDFDLIFQDYLAKNFPDPEQFTEPGDKRLAELRRTTEVNKLRKQFADEDQKFKVAARTAPDKEAEEKAAAAQAEERIAAFKQMVNNHEVVTNLLSSKKITFGSGDNAVTMEVEKPEELVAIATSPNYWDVFKDENGDLNLGLVLESIFYAKNRDSFVKSIFDKGKSAGIKAEKDELGNAGDKTQTAAGSGVEKDLNTLFAEKGKDVSR